MQDGKDVQWPRTHTVVSRDEATELPIIWRGWERSREKNSSLVRTTSLVPWNARLCSSGGRRSFIYRCCWGHPKPDPRVGGGHRIGDQGTVDAVETAAIALAVKLNQRQLLLCALKSTNLILFVIFFKLMATKKKPRSANGTFQSTIVAKFPKQYTFRILLQGIDMLKFKNWSKVMLYKLCHY